MIALVRVHVYVYVWIDSLCLCMSIGIICKRVLMYIHAIHIYVSVHVSIHVCISTCTYVCVYMRVCMCVRTQQVERQWVWEIRSVSHYPIRIPPLLPISRPTLNVSTVSLAAAAVTAVAVVTAPADAVAVAPAAPLAGGGQGEHDAMHAPAVHTAANSHVLDTRALGAGGESEGSESGACAGWDTAQTFTVSLALQRPASLWGEAAEGVVHTSAPRWVRGHDGGRVVLTGKGTQEMRVQVRHAHDASPVYVHLVSDKGLVVSAWVLTFAHSASKAKQTPCGVRIALEELRFARQGHIVLPTGLGARGSGGQQVMDLAALKLRMRTDLAVTLGCDAARVQIIKVAAREALPHGPALQVFRALDSDGSGQLENAELRQALRRMRVHGVLVDDLDALLGILDPSGDGKVSFEEFVAALDAGIDVDVLLVAPPVNLDNSEDAVDVVVEHPSPLQLAEKLYEEVCCSTYGTSRGGGGSALVGMLRFCGEVEVVPTSMRAVRGQSTEDAAAVAIQKRVRGVQTRDKKKREMQHREVAALKIQRLQRTNLARRQRAEEVLYVFLVFAWKCVHCTIYGCA